MNLRQHSLTMAQSHTHPVVQNRGQILSGRSVTALLELARSGDREALPQLVAALNNELRNLAGAYMRRERKGHTLQTTALVNEAFLKLVDQTHAQWQDRRHFFAAAAQAMRRILLQYARDHGRQKRGGGRQKIQFSDDLVQISEPDIDLLALDEAMKELEAFDQQKAKLVELRYFAGLTIQEAAEILEISQATLKREWQVAKAWLYRKMNQGDSA